MSTALYSLTSELHSETAISPANENFIQEIEKAVGEKFVIYDDFRSYGTHERSIIYIRTGGTEGLFRSLSLSGNITLLSSGESNSLAASMEILSYLRKKGQSGEILHGTANEIAASIKTPREVKGRKVPENSFIHELSPEDFGGIRLGVIGHPSDWLISSDVNYSEAKLMFNVELVDIQISELISLVKSKCPDTSSFKGSETIYEGLKEIVSRYQLSGLTLRCFDLLDSLHNTGCLALARLNAEGIPSSCEGDIPALLSMVYLQKKKGCPGFQCNLSRIEGDNLLFAHCTVPLQMVNSYRFMTHFESGIGTAVKGELHTGPVEIFKIAPSLKHYVSIPGRIISNESRRNLCRTQIIVNAPGAASYFLHEPFANHHLVTYAGDLRKVPSCASLT